MDAVARRQVAKNPADNLPLAISAPSAESRLGWQVKVFVLYAEPIAYGWTGQQPSSGFCDLAPSILHYNWF
jgi:hypothetical protein